jgi:hypothetical protein
MQYYGTYGKINLITQIFVKCHEIIKLEQKEVVVLLIMANLIAGLSNF